MTRKSKPVLTDDLAQRRLLNLEEEVKRLRDALALASANAVTSRLDRLETNVAQVVDLVTAMARQNAATAERVSHIVAVVNDIRAAVAPTGGTK